LPKVDNRVLQTEATNNFNQAYADIAKAFDLRLHPNLLKSTFKDKNSLGSFMALANQIQPNGAGKNYFKLAGDSNYMQALRTAMNPASGGSVAGTGDMGDSIDTLRSGAERAMGGQKTITINIRSFIENFNSQAITAKEGYAEIEQKLKESFTRIMASAAGMSPAGDY